MSTEPKDRLGKIGIWSMELRFGDKAEILAAAAELEGLGYGALWIPGGIDDNVLNDIASLLAVTKKAVIASGILNIWKHKPADVGAWWNSQPPEHQARILLGLGVSHAPIIGETWGKPLTAMKHFLAGLGHENMPASALCLAALRPKMLELAAEHTAGAHPYLVTPEHTAQARTILGPNALLAPEQGVILDTDPATAREKARTVIGHYSRLPNYVNSWLALGFTQEEISAGSDRLADALFAWGTPEQIATRVNEHLAAGADHVCIQLITGEPRPSVAAALPGWRTLAAALL
jgi:probable F420-dependent oxidoreductase